MKAVTFNGWAKTDPENVINAFLDSDALATWWGVERSLVTPNVGCMYALAWNVGEHGFGYITTAMVSRLECGRFLELSNYTYFSPGRPILGAMTLTIEAMHTKRGSSFSVTQKGYGNGPNWDWYYEAVLSAWPIVGQDLISFLSQ